MIVRHSAPAKKPLTLLHLANHKSTNIGNGALILGTERVLTEDIDREMSFTRDPWEDYSQGLRKFDTSFVDRINQESDGLLVGAAVSLNGDDRYAHAGMRFDLPYDLWPSITKPMIFYALSYRGLHSGEYHHLDQLRRALDYVMKSPRGLFSVRNDGTKPWLESMLGNETDRIVAIPDPAMYVPTADVHHPELEEGVTNVLVSLNNEDESARFGMNGAGEGLAWGGRAQQLARRVGGRVRRIAGFPNKTRDRKRVFLESLAAVLERVFKNRRVNFILCPHYFHDYQIMAELLSLCSWRIAHEATVSCGVPRIAGAPGFYDLYTKVDAVLSMRVHSMSPAVGLGTPLVALVSDPRMSHFMGDAGLSEFAVDIFDPDLTDKVYGLLTRILDRREDVQRRLTEVRTSMRERTQAYHTRIASLLQS